MQSVLTVLREHVGNPLAFRAPPPPLHVEEGAPTKGGGHTTYALYRSKPRWLWRKGEAQAFPSSNFARTTSEHQKEVRELVAKKGYRIVS